MKTAVIYARYSCDNQTEQSIEGQLRVCEEYAQRNDIVIVETYIDRAMTGTNDNRPDFQRMIKDSAKKEWNYVLVYKLDRFSRNKYESVIHKKTLKDNGVKIISCMENIPDTPEGIILESLLEGMNQYYSAELAQKVKRGMKELRLKGYFQGGYIPYGYKLENKKLVVNEEQAEIINYIYELYLQGKVVRTIIETLTSKGILNKGKPFNRNTIYSILKNEKYCGVYKLNDEIFDNMYPQLLSRELFEKVKIKMSKYHYGRQSIKVTYLLRNKLKCGYCGMPINAECGTLHNGLVNHYYKCYGKKRNINNCKKMPIRKDVLENLVIDNVIKEMQKPNIMDIIVKRLLQVQNETFSESKELSILQRQKKQIENTIANIMFAIEKGVVTKTTTNRLKEAESQLEELEKNIIKEKSKSSVKISEKVIREYYTNLLKQDSQTLINYLIKEIKVYDDKLEITFNSPIKTGPDENQGFLFFTNEVKITIIKEFGRVAECKKFIIKFYIKN